MKGPAKDEGSTSTSGAKNLESRPQVDITDDDITGLSDLLSRLGCKAMNRTSLVNLMNLMKERM